MSYCKSSGYYRNVAFLMAFDILIQSGHKMMNLGGDVAVDIDIGKHDIYKAQKKIKEMLEHIAPFQKEELPIKVKHRAQKILQSVVVLTRTHESISPEIIAAHLLFNYFTQYEHPKTDSAFAYFANENNYYPILDRVENSLMIDNKAVYEMVLKIIEENR